MPDYSANNPYQRLLAEALRAQGVAVARRPQRGRRRPLPHPACLAARAAGRRVLHLHWTHEYLKGRGRRRRRSIAPQFLGQLRLLRRLGVRIVWTMHNLGGHDGPATPTRWRSTASWCACADAVICHCAAARDAAITAYGLDAIDAARLHVVPHGSYLGVYPDTVTPAEARARLALPADARVLLFLGAVRGYKGTDDLVDRLPRHRRSRRPAAHRRPAAPRRVEGHLAAAAAADPRIRAPSRVRAGRRRSRSGCAPRTPSCCRSATSSPRAAAILALSFGRPVVAPRWAACPRPCRRPRASSTTRTRRTRWVRRCAARWRATWRRWVGPRWRARELDWGAIAARTATSTGLTARRPDRGLRPVRLGRACPAASAGLRRRRWPCAPVAAQAPDGDLARPHLPEAPRRSRLRSAECSMCMLHDRPAGRRPSPRGPARGGWRGCRTR